MNRKTFSWQSVLQDWVPGAQTVSRVGSSLATCAALDSGEHLAILSRKLTVKKEKFVGSFLCLFLVVAVRDLGNRFCEYLLTLQAIAGAR